MDFKELIVDQLRTYGVGRRKLDDELFVGDKPPPRLGVYDADDESLCHKVIKTPCNILGCNFTADSLLEFESHYNANHRYSCSQCKKVLPSPHLLDLHIQEKHDSFFAVMAAKKASYCCYIEVCKEKFINPEARLDHCVKIHKIPRDYRFDQKLKTENSKTKKQNFKSDSMELDKDNSSEVKQFTFTNSKVKGFTKYTGRKFTADTKENSSADVNMEDS